MRDNLAQVIANMNRYKQEALDKAIPLALNRAGDMAMVAASREIRARGYNFKLAEIKGAMRIIYAGKSRMKVTIHVRRRPETLMKFNAVQTKEGVRVKVAGVPKVIKGAFIGQMRNGALGVFVEDKSKGKTTVRHHKQNGFGSKGGWQAYPLRKLSGPSIGAVFSTAPIQAAALAASEKGFRQRLLHELRRASK